MNNTQKKIFAIFTALTSMSMNLSATSDPLTIVVETGNETTISGNLSGSFVKAGAGTATFSGTNEDMDLNITAGTARVHSPTSLGTSATPHTGATTLNGGTLEIGAAITLSEPLNLTANSTFLADADVTLAGSLVGTGSHTLVLSGTGNTTFAGDSSASNALLDINNPTVILNGGVLPSGNKTVNSDSVLRLATANSNSLPGLTSVEGGATLVVDDSLSVASNVFELLNLKHGSTLRLGDGSTWAHNITVGTAS